jgi:hypothetical protein
MKHFWKLISKQRGAVEACWAHNSEVGGSKPFAAMYFYYCFIIKIKAKKYVAANGFDPPTSEL